MEAAVRADGRQPGRSAVPGADVLELTVGEVAHGGWCVAREAGGRVVFVRHALPGEQVRARVTDATTRFARAEAVEILRASPDRVEPRCPHARPGGCGGCDWQHADLPAQRRLKAQVVRHQLRRIAGVDRDVTVEPMPGDTEGLGWRTRVRYSVAPDGTAGLLGHRSHEVIDVGDCPLVHPLVRRAGVTRRRWEHTTAVEVVTAPGSGEIAVIVTPAAGRRRTAADGAGAGGTGAVPGEPGPAAPGLADAVPAGSVQADSVLVARHGGRLTTLRGRGYLRQIATGRAWRVGAGGFWQVHPAAADTLTAAMLEALRPDSGDVALDLYCGAGLFAGALAEAVGPSGEVAGVESDRAAVRDARHNLRRTPWARVRRGSVAQVLAEGGGPPATLAVLDPPRPGAGRAVIESLLAPPAAGEQALRRVVYVSCDPATLARDIAISAGSGWRLAALRAFDAFPMTHHVECVATLTRE